MESPLSTPREPRDEAPPAEPAEQPLIRLLPPPRGSVPELGIVVAPWGMPGMKIVFARGFVTVSVAVALALVLDWRLEHPGAWPAIAIVSCTVLGGVWAMREAWSAVRTMREGNERAVREELPPSRGRR
jgi:hypothetical protein